MLAAGSCDSTDADDALAKLCQTYWYPLYSYVRMRGYSSHDAQDLTQSFFARLMDRRALARVTRERGKFRSYLLTALKHFLIDEWKKARRAKRGGALTISLGAQDAERRFALELVEHLTPEAAFEQNWALALLDTVFERLRGEQAAAGRVAIFNALKFCLTGERSAIPYEELGKQLKIPENTVKTLVHRLRQRYRELLRLEIANTVEDPKEIEEELHYLFRTLAS